LSRLVLEHRHDDSGRAAAQYFAPEAPSGCKTSDATT